MIELIDQNECNISYCLYIIHFSCVVQSVIQAEGKQVYRDLCNLNTAAPKTEQIYHQV